MTRRVKLQFAVWFACKTRDNAAVSGTYQAARNLRKQGVPIEFALAILSGRNV
jgi:hypothetical protein